MAGRGNPSEEPEGAPGGSDDEYRSVVFDESFVEAARLQEFSARERLEDEEHAAVRSRPAYPSVPAPGLPRQGLVLVLLVVVAFGTALYVGIRSPYPAPRPAPGAPMTVTMVPLAPRGAVPGSTPRDLFEHSPAARYRTGAEGVTLPVTHSSAHFSESQLLAALTSAKDYVVASSLDPAVLSGGEVRSVRLRLDPEQQEQFDASLERPRADGRHAATGWMVRFDPARVALADPDVRVRGTLAVREAGTDALEVTADHIFVYAVRPTGGAPGVDTRNGEATRDASLFMVRREVRFRFERADLRDRHLRVLGVTTRAGPMECTAGTAEALVPLLAGERPTNDGRGGTDPYARGRTPESMCGLLARDAQPKPSRPDPPPAGSRDG